MSRIFTRTGDQGTTARYDGVRVPKNDPLIEVNGTIDECNSMLGAARAFNTDPELDELLKQIQNLLITAGSEITNGEADQRLPFITEANVVMLEQWMEARDAELPELRRFILPGGEPASAHLHLARTCARKVERRLAALAGSVHVNPVLLKYFSRLADTLFVLARLAAVRSGKTEEVWQNPRQAPAS